MKEMMKGFVRDMPVAFDFARSLRRRFSREFDPQYHFLNAFSRMRDGNVTFLQIGASDGLRNDPFREFVIRDEWRGVLVEPMPGVFGLLRKNYARYDGLKFVNVAIGDHNGEATIYGLSNELLITLPKELRLEYLRKASFDRAHVEHHVDAKHRWGIVPMTVPSMTMEALLARHTPREPFNLLALDCEGYEPKLLRSINWTYFRPDVVFYEAHRYPGGDDEIKATEQLLRNAGYVIHNIKGDTAAVRRDLKVPGY